MRYGLTKPPLGAQLSRGHRLCPDVIALLLNEGTGGNITELVSGRSIAPSTNNWRRVTTKNGPVLEHTGTDNHYDLGRLTALHYGSVRSVSVVIGYRKTDATLRDSCPFGIDNSTRIQAHLPYVNGTVYWDFGNTVEGDGRLSVAGLTIGDDIWVFTGGQRGREIWQNGILRASNTGTAEIVNTNSLGFRFGGTANAPTDLAEVSVFYLYGRQLSPQDAREISAAPYSPIAPSSPRRFFVGGPPTPLTGVVKAKGAAIPPLRVPASGSITLAAGSQAVLAVSADFDGTAELFNSSAVSQGAMTQDARANNSGKVQSLIFSKYVPGAGSYYTIFTMSAAGVAAGALLELANVSAANQIDQTAVATGSSASPSSGATPATAQDYEILIGAIGTEGPAGDTQGAWSNSFQPIAYVGSTGGAAAANVTLSVGYRIVAATGAQTAAKTGITSRQWGAAIATYKGLIVTAPAADPVTYVTTSPLASGTVSDFYSEYLEVSGGVAPYTFVVTAGSLPTGLTLSSDGGITGTPTTAAVYNFTARATDSAAETEDLAVQITISAAAMTRKKFRPYAVTLPGRLF